MLLQRLIFGAIRRVMIASIFAGFGIVAAGTSAAGNIAIKGYDAVAYFKAGKAKQGIESFLSGRITAYSSVLTLT